MTLRCGKRGLSFEVVGYRYPARADAREEYDGDAQWLTVRITYTDETGTYEYEDECLQTFELGELIGEIAAVADGGEPLYISDLTEPYLTVAAARADDKILLGIEFVYDTEGGVWKKHKIAEAVAPEAARRILEELRAAYALYPPRGPACGKG